MDLKKKIGPLPLWAWIAASAVVIVVVVIRRRSAAASSTSSSSTVDPNNPLGLTYAQESSDIGQGIDPSTGESYASEQSTADSASGGGGDSGSGSDDVASNGTTTTTDNTEPAWASSLDTDVQTLSSTIQGGGITDAAATDTPVQSFSDELGDLASGISAVSALQGVLTPVATTAAAPTSSGSGSAGSAAAPAKTPIVKTSITTSPVKAADKILANPKAGSDGVAGGSLGALEALNKPAAAPKVPAVAVSGKKTTTAAKK